MNDAKELQALRKLAYATRCKVDELNEDNNGEARKWNRHILKALEDYEEAISYFEIVEVITPADKEEELK